MNKIELINSLKDLRRDATEDKDKASVAEAIDILIKCCEFILKSHDHIK